MLALKVMKRAAVVLAGLLALPAEPAASRESDSFLIKPAGDGQGGRAGSSASFGTSPSVQEAGSSGREAASFLLRSGFNAGIPFPGKIADLSVVERSSHSAGLEWTAPYGDQERSTDTVSKYLLRYSTTGAIRTDADFSTATVYNNSFVPLPPGLLENRLVVNLEPNTTYYFVVESANVHSVRSERSVQASTSTLAARPGTAAEPFTGVFATSVTVNWLANGNPAYTEYNVQASTASDFTGTLYGPSVGPTGWLVGTSTTVISLTVDTTYYFRVRARNLDLAETGFETLGSTRTLRYSVDIIQLEFDFLSLGLGVSSITASGITIQNDGETGETFRIRATTTTAGSQWVLSTDGTAGLDEPVLQAAFHATRPTDANFGSEDLVTEAYQTSDGARYSVDGTATGVSVPVGGTRTLWFRLTTPTISRIGPQTITVYVQGAAP